MISSAQKHHPLGFKQHPDWKMLVYNLYNPCFLRIPPYIHPSKRSNHQELFADLDFKKAYGLGAAPWAVKLK